MLPVTGIHGRAIAPSPKLPRRGGNDVPAQASGPSAGPAAIAPDGIAIHTFAVPEGAHAGVAEGRIPPGRYRIHRHLSLEQYTYVISGRIRVVTGSEAHPEGYAVELAPGELLLTLPGESLQYVNDGTETARVLFICAPPYPVDDRDTHILDAHGPAGRHEAEAAISRLEEVRAAFLEAIDERLASLRARLPAQ